MYSEGAGIGREIPAAVAVPADAEDVGALVRWAAREKHTLIPRGSGSGMAGGAIGPGIIVDLSRIVEVGTIDKEKLSVHAGTGVICKTIDDAARTMGLRFPVDPSSAAFCTIGGMISTNAAGPHSLKLGTMRSWVRSLDCVFSDGSRARITRGEAPPTVRPVQDFLAQVESIREEWGGGSDHSLLRKDSSGYALARFFETGELIDLIVGSEGTLAIVVGAELALIPVPKVTSSVMASFKSLDSAAKGAEAARAAGVSACELLDKTFLDLAATAPESTVESRAHSGSAAAVLLIEIESDDERASSDAVSRVRAALDAAGADSVRIALTAESEREVWELRHAASPILSRLKQLTSMQFIEDGAVPPEKLPDYVLGVREALKRGSVEGVIFGHAGDSHVHVNPLIDLSRPDWRQTVAGLLEDVVALTAALHGTLTGEHGDGRLRTPLMPRVWSAPAMRTFALVKRSFDPAGTLNPGVKVPLAGQTAINAVKYDPDLAPLPAQARKALDDLVARRGYGDFRLSLIDGIS
jgi:FAD/FMN-containing dehydrogenase